MSHKNSKTVTVFRAGSFLSRAQGKEIDEFLSTTKQSIGSYWESPSSKRIASGLTFEEEAFLLPLLLDVPAEDREFRKKVSSFYADIDTPIPYKTGLVLEIGMDQDNDRAVAPKNMPISIDQYLRYRQIKGHPQVAANKEEADGNQMKHYYIFENTDTIKKNDRKREDKDASMQIYLQIKNDVIKVDSMLTVLGMDPREYVGKNAFGEKQDDLRIASETDPTEFAKLYNEGDLEIRYWIKTMINTGVFKMIGAKVLDGETNKMIGNTIEEVVFYFKDEENSENVSMFKSRMQEAVQKPVTVRTRKAVSA